jgi:putative glutamine amidotransferase
LERTSDERDEFEMSLARWAMESDLPLLGICRGMQIMNVVQGGSLNQDLGPERNATHRPRLGSFEGADHEIEVTSGSLASMAGGDAGRHRVHSHHHQAVASLGDGLLISAAADDGVVEAVELEGHPFALGVQWHPEADERSQVVGALVRAARATAGT